MQPTSNLGGCGQRRTLGTSQDHQDQRDVERGKDGPALREFAAAYLRATF